MGPLGPVTGFPLPLYRNISMTARWNWRSFVCLGHNESETNGGWFIYQFHSLASSACTFSSWYDIWYDIFVNCKWVATRWQMYNTHLHTSNTQNDIKQTIHRTTQNLSTTQNLRTIQKVWKSLEECGPCPDLASYTLAFALQLRKKHRKTSVRVVEQ
jgi:hypothetical protein